MIPPFEPDSGNLPPGIHETTWDELVARYGYTPHRLSLLAGLKAGLDALRAAGCRRAYVDGSFVTAKTIPGDFDVCWDMSGVQGRLLDPLIVDFRNGRAVQKSALGGEFFPAQAVADTVGTRFLDYFQRGRDGLPKGIVAIDLGGLP